ncbi:MAG TPA: hypothetical protein VK168_20965 [Saprospiraceae bacterium]|nr:hypothetical protein [Saprospiraceae bacterium]
MQLPPICIITVLFITGCNGPSEYNRGPFIESKPSFFDLRHGDWLTNPWIRKPENLLSIHETFKSIGYPKILGNQLANNPVIVQDIYINKYGYNLLDSLVLTYRQRERATKYYREFWTRREKEQNDSVVFIILSDIQYACKEKANAEALQQHTNHSIVNDTLKSLLEITYQNTPLTPAQALQDFNTLRQLGFHQSACNLLFESYKYQDIPWNRDSLVRTLTPSGSVVYPWFGDDTN